MGFWDIWNSTTDAVKRNSPDLTPVTKKLKECLPQLSGREDLEKIGRALTQLGYKTATHPATKEALNLAIPGSAQWFNIVRALLNDERHAQSVHDDKKHEHLREEIGHLREEIKKLQEQNELIIKGLESHKKVHLDSKVAQKPEEVLRIFMTKGFKGADFLDDQVLLKEPLRRGCFKHIDDE